MAWTIQAFATWGAIVGGGVCYWLHLLRCDHVQCYHGNLRRLDEERRNMEGWRRRSDKPSWRSYTDHTLLEIVGQEMIQKGWTYNKVKQVIGEEPTPEFDNKAFFKYGAKVVAEIRLKHRLPAAAHPVGSRLPACA